MAKISNELEFTETTGRDIAAIKYGKEWPLVYLLFNDEEVYIGETVDASTRMSQHYENPERRKLNRVRLISDDTFNKSVILDLEAFLISHMSADTRFKYLQNGNAGHQKHNYFQKDYYESQFSGIWEGLRRYGLATQEIKKIENSNLFKYSPFKSLTTDQYAISMSIIDSLVRDINTQTERSFIVNGAPGTGKTVLGIYLMKLLTSNIDDDLDSDDEQLIENLQKIHQLWPNFKIGIVVSMANLRNILKDVFRSTYGLSDAMVYSPSEIANSTEKFDLLIVDEAHRLKAPRNVGAEIGNIQQNNLKLGLDKTTGTQLDWIIKKSKYQIFFYDAMQTIKRADVDASDFELIKEKGARSFELETQIRCKNGGEAYINYIRSLFSDTPPVQAIDFKDYDLKVFDDVYEMTETIRKKNDDEKVGLCRNIAGYAWPWNTKGIYPPENKTETDALISRGNYDIDIDGHKYIWNVKYDGWISTPNSVNEIGCIHTIQGFDLNYAGVIIGKDLRYDEANNRLYIDRDSYFDKSGKNATDDAALKKYILNIYSVLCTRGINGTYIYACDEGLRNYLKRFIKTNLNH